MAWHTISSNGYSHDMQVLDTWHYMLATLPETTREDMIATWPEMATARLDGAELVVTLDKSSTNSGQMSEFVIDLTYWFENETPAAWWGGEPWAWDDDGTCRYCNAPWSDEHDRPCEDCADD